MCSWLFQDAVGRNEPADAGQWGGWDHQNRDAAFPVGLSEPPLEAAGVDLGGYKDPRSGASGEHWGASGRCCFVAALGPADFGEIV